MDKLDLSNEICMICGDRLGSDPCTQLTPNYWVHSECLKKKENKLESIREQEQREDELERLSKLNEEVELEKLEPLRQVEKKKEATIHELQDLEYDNY